MRCRLEYSILDVFAERPLEGNPLAVIHDARGLSDEAMQAIARETNLSETTFVLPSDDPEKDRMEGVRVRIFTTHEELPFAGHPTLGTACWLHLNYPPLQGASELKLRLNIGPIDVAIQAGGNQDEGVFATMRQNDAIFGDRYDAREVAAVLGLAENDLLEGAIPQTVSTGNPFCIVALKPEALKRLAIPHREANAWLALRKTRWFYCIAPCGPSSNHASSTKYPAWTTRMQFNFVEDPATGSAAGCAIAWMIRHGWAASGQEVILHQGLEIGRPSRLIVRAIGHHDHHHNHVNSITISGRTIPVADGAFFLPL
jgi:trans-2,3-dihydro-3-hydroxyanthranilate isomerase